MVVFVASSGFSLRVYYCGTSSGHGASLVVLLVPRVCYGFKFNWVLVLH